MVAGSPHKSSVWFESTDRFKHKLVCAPIDTPNNADTGHKSGD